MSNLQIGQVVVSHGQEVIVECGNSTLVACRLRRRGHTRPVCGDRVRWRAAEGGTGIIEAIEARRTLIERGDFRGRPRPLAANVDHMAIVIADPPGVDTTLLDRYLVLAAHIGLNGLILINKADRLDIEARARIHRTLAFYIEHLGTLVQFASATSGEGLDALVTWLKSGTAIVVGQSGVGKSSLVNRLIPELDIRISSLSAASGQGRHTTTTTTLFRLPGDNGAIIDSPGVRTLRLDHLPRAAVLEAFPEITRYIGHCRFNDCRHNGEPGCAIATALARGDIPASRYASLQRLLTEAG